ncbi:MAG TPA: helix-turn-helix domain-containing protein [Herpetosiphonaceae bacterium]|nr:helix-turn-helix domain-containing protein [Herpetosiphonaceae bacterium]
MPHSLLEPDFVAVTEEEQAALHDVARLLDHTGDEGQGLPAVIGPHHEAVELPASVVRVLQSAIHHLIQGHAVRLVPLDTMVTTQQAADLLNVSRPYLIKLLDQGKIPYSKTGTHRRLSTTDVLAYKAQRDVERRETLDQLTQFSQELGLYDA